MSFEGSVHDMSVTKDSYYIVAVKTSQRTSGGDVSKNRVNPLPGQGFDPSCFVRCSRKLRDDYPTGTVFLIWASLSDREGGTKFLDSYWGWELIPVTESQARKLIDERRIGDWVVYKEPQTLDITSLLI